MKREVSERVAIDWLMLKQEYLRTGVSLRALAAQHGVGQRSLERAAADGGWAAERRSEQAAAKAAAGKEKATGERHGGTGIKRAAPRRGRAVAKANEAEAAATPRRQRTRPQRDHLPGGEPPALVGADTIVRLRAISGQLTDQLAIAATQLDKQVVVSKRSAPKAKGEHARPCAGQGGEAAGDGGGFEIVKTLVSCEKLQRLSSTLKNLNDIVKTGGGDEQSVGMVAALMKKLDDEAAKGGA